MTTIYVHTPGPWRVSRLLDGVAVEAAAFDGSWHYVADRVHGSSAPESNANAHLIAAAPEMYAAIKSSLEYLDETLGPCDDGCDCILHDLHAAIAKAEPAKAVA